MLWTMQEMIEAITKMVGREVKVYVSPATIPDTASGSSRASEGGVLLLLNFNASIRDANFSCN